MTAAATSAGHSAETDRLQTIQAKEADSVSVQQHQTACGDIRHHICMASQSTGASRASASFDLHVSG
jgi:hypothetical protein